MNHITPAEARLRRCLQMAFMFESERESMSPQKIYSLFYKDRSEHAAKRALTRDRDFLRANGFDITYDENNNLYTLKNRRQRLRSLHLDEREAASLAVAAGAMKSEELFPLPFPLRFALKKLTGLNSANRIEVEDDTQLISQLSSDSDIEVQRETASTLIEAILEKHYVTFTYEKANGDASTRSGIPAGLALYRGRWYALVDTESGARTFTVTKISNLTTSEKVPQALEDAFAANAKSSTDKGLTAREIIGLPFQWGDDSSGPVCEVEMIIPAESAHRVAAITGGSGLITTQQDGSLLWRIEYRNIRQLFQTYIENDLRLAPGWPDVSAQFQGLLEEAVANHG